MGRRDRSCFCSRRAACLARVTALAHAVRAVPDGLVRLVQVPCYFPDVLALLSLNRRMRRQRFGVVLRPRHRRLERGQAHGRHEEASAWYGPSFRALTDFLSCCCCMEWRGIGGYADLCIMVRYTLHGCGRSVVETGPARLIHVHFMPLCAPGAKHSARRRGSP